MGTVTIQRFTYKNPISMIGEEAGICWGADTSNPEKNYKRGLDCLESEHGRTFEFPDVYMILDGYSARVIREWYTHIGGSPPGCRPVHGISIMKVALIMSLRPALRKIPLLKEFIGEL